MPKFSVVILTAPPPGQSAEAGGAYVKIDGRESLLRAVELFLNRDNIGQVQVVFPADEMEEGKKKFGNHLGFSGVKLVAGGPRWVDQVVAARATIIPEATHVLVHDAARPAVPSSDVDAVLTAAETHPAVGMVTPVRTTLVETDEGGSPVAYHLPQHYSHLLTPQVFDRKTYDEWATKKVEVHPSRVTLLKGSPLNVRVGGPGDAVLVKAMLSLLPKPKAKSGGPFDEAQW